MARENHPHNDTFGVVKSFDTYGPIVFSRRSFLKAGLGGLFGLSVPELLRSRANAGATGRPSGGRKSVILLWMAGGPSHIDTWDPKPDAPREFRGPFNAISTSLPGVRVCEHLPEQAKLMHKFTLIRSVDSSASNHNPFVFQTGSTVPSRENKGAGYPAIGSVVAKFHGANQPGMPPYVAFGKKEHIWGAEHLRVKYDPFMAETAGERFRLAPGLTQETLQERVGLLRKFDGIRRDLDLSGAMEGMDAFQTQAMEMVLSGRAKDAFDISKEPESAHRRYGDHPWCQQGLLARRLVEAGVSFVTISLSPYGSSGIWDTHGGEKAQKVYGGIENGLKPLLLPFDHLITTLVEDLDERGLLDDVLVLTMGDFGRDPRINGDKEWFGGRHHWLPVMSICMAGGEFKHGQVIGTTDNRGGRIVERRIGPGDLAATIYRHMGVSLDVTYLDPTGRPRHIVEDGKPIAELLG